MAPIPPFQYSAFQAHASSSQVVRPLPTLDEGAASVDVIYKVVWTAGNPPGSWPGQRSSTSRTILWRKGGLHPPSFSPRETPSTGQGTSDTPSIWFPTSSGSVRITGSPGEGSIRRSFQSHCDAPPISTIPEGKIPCIAMLDRGTLGAFSTCLYDPATDSFSNFSINDGAWAHQNRYHDYGDIQISTRKWFQGSWVSVEDDNGHDFLFFTVEREHGLVRVWRPNVVAKRMVGTGPTALSYEEGLRLGLNEDDDF